MEEEAKREMLVEMMVCLVPLMQAFKDEIQAGVLEDMRLAIKKFHVTRIPDGETIFSPEHRLIYERQEGEQQVIRFKNNLKNEEAREVMCGLFLGFSEEERKDILNELAYYHRGEGKPGDVALAISGGLKTGKRLS